MANYFKIIDNISDFSVDKIINKKSQRPERVPGVVEEEINISESRFENPCR